jgi:hypothetical protein
MKPRQARGEPVTRATATRSPRGTRCPMHQTMTAATASASSPPPSSTTISIHLWNQAVLTPG